MPPPPLSLLCVALTPSCFLLIPAVLYKYTETHILNTDRLCQFFLTSECVHKRTVRTAMFPSCHLWSGRQVTLGHTEHQWLKSAWRLFNMYLQAPKEPNDMVESLFQIGQLFVSANAPKLYSFIHRSGQYLPTPRLHTHHQQLGAVIRAQRSGRSLWNKVGRLTYIPIAPVALVTSCLWGKGIFVGGGDGSRDRASQN